MAKIINHLFNADQKQQRRLRSRLVLSSPELVASKPVNEINIEDVIEKAQVSQGTFYKCFRSISDLLNVSGKQAGQELLLPIVLVGSTIPDIATRMAIKTRLAIRTITRVPVLAKLMLKTEWPFRDVNFKGYQDIKQDIVQGIEKGCFTDMPPEIGVNLVISTLRGAVQDIIDSPRNQEYEDQVIYHLLLSLGVNSRTAKEISQIPLDQLPPLKKRGLVGKFLNLVS